MNRDALKGLGEGILNYMSGMPDDMWAEWLKAPFEEAAGWGDIALTTALMEAGAKGNGIMPAIIGGHRRLVRDLLEMGASPTAKDANGDAPIHLAASAGRGLIVRTLLIEGAEVDEPDGKGHTPLHLASASGDDVGVRALLAAGACPRHRHASTTFCALDFAAWSGHVDIMKTLLAKGADVNARGSEGRGVLHHAAEDNQVGVIEFLAREAGVEVDWKGDGGITPLHIAAAKGHLPAVDALVAAGADTSLRTSTDYYCGYYSPCRYDCSALDFTAHAGHMDILKALVRHGADVNACSSRRSLTALHHATAGNKLDAMRFLLDEGADANAGGGWKPIHSAVENKSAEAVQVLAQHGADLCAIGSEEGLSPLASAAGTLDFGLVNALLAAGANLNPPGEPFPALQMAISSGARSQEMVKLLLQQGADVNATDHEGKNALHRATSGSNVGIIHMLIEAGAAVDGYDDSYPSPLHVACGYDCLGFIDGSSYDAVKALLGHGASLDLRDGVGNTPLHYCVVSGNCASKIVDLLLRAGADESIVNDDGETPADRMKSKYRSSRDHPEYEEFCKPVLTLLDGAPADRAWRRRGLLVLCRAFQEKASLAPEETRANLPRAAKRRAPFGGGGGEGVGGELSAATSGSNSFSRVMRRLVRIAEEGVFRNVISFL